MRLVDAVIGDFSSVAYFSLVYDIELIHIGEDFLYGDKFSKIITVPGSYEIVADMVLTDLTNISTSGKFTIK